MTIVDECISELEAMGCRVVELAGDAGVMLQDGEIWLEGWRFRLLCVRVHGATEHHCRIA